MKIMVVDDSKAMRMIVIRTLKQAGLGDNDIRQATNGAEAFAAIRQDPPDLVLSDWNMPEMSGLDLLRAINSEKIQLKFGFVTSQGTSEMKDIADKEGALFVITKPFTPEIFEQTLTPFLP
jgi:two-component system, chemotaxis family, chemotaxis protein CheY